MNKKHSMGIMGRAIRYLGIKKMSLKEIERDRALYNKLNTDTRFSTGRKHDFICRADKYAPNGQVGGNYFIQDIWGARKVFDAAPAVHYDVGSSVGGFIAHLLSMKQKIILIDVRQMNNDFDTPFLREPRAPAMRGGGDGLPCRRGLHLRGCYELGGHRSGERRVS